MLRFDDRVAVVTGAGGGLGRAHAMLLASRGAKVVVNDLGGAATGGGQSQRAADAVVDEIKAAGGEAVANYDSVEDGGRIVETALDSFGRIDLVINNAGILHDASFHKMTEEDWDLIYRVHVLGSFRVTHAAWPHLRDQAYGRVVMTSSAAGLYGNFGQANYSMAKLGLLGLANTLAVEGAAKNVHVNTIAPLAGSRLTKTVLPEDILQHLDPGYVSPLVAYLCHESCEDTGAVFEVGGGFMGRLRWARAEGKMMRLGREIRPEDVAQHMPQISDFAQSTHPGTVAESFGPILANIQAGPSKGGNEFIDVDEALGFEFPEQENAYSERDVSLYALGIGARGDEELDAIFELHPDGFRVVPSFAVIPAINVVLEAYKRGEKAPGLNYGLERLLHGEQYTELFRPLPGHADLVHRMRVKDIFDKGKNALVVFEIDSFEQGDDAPLMRNRITTLIRGAGGWGGERGPQEVAAAAPDRAADQVVEEDVPENQALIYRLSGDWNPLHADPSMAEAFGFDRPILHGLCTYGYATRHVFKAFPEVDPRLCKSIAARFSSHVYPGDRLRTEVWRDEGRLLFRTSVTARNAVVLQNGVIELYDQVPRRPEKPAGAPPETAQAGPTTSDAFRAIGDHIAQDPALAGQVGHVFQFELSEPDSVWTIDLKNGAGAVHSGPAEKAECTLSLKDQDFMAMCLGDADPQQLYMSGRLKIKGNIMASQKLRFLEELDKSALTAAGGSSDTGATGAAGAPRATTAPAPKAPAGPDFFAALADTADRLTDGGPPVSIVFRLEAPDSAWTLTLGSEVRVASGETEGPTMVVTVADDAVASLRSGASVRSLYQRGVVRLDGDLRVAARLEALLQAAR